MQESGYSQPQSRHETASQAGSYRSTASPRTTSINCRSQWHAMALSKGRWQILRSYSIRTLLFCSTPQKSEELLPHFSIATALSCQTLSHLPRGFVRNSIFQNLRKHRYHRKVQNDHWRQLSVSVATLTH